MGCLGLDRPSSCQKRLHIRHVWLVSSWGPRRHSSNNTGEWLVGNLQASVLLRWLNKQLWNHTQRHCRVLEGQGCGFVHDFHSRRVILCRSLYVCTNVCIVCIFLNPEYHPANSHEMKFTAVWTAGRRNWLVRILPRSN